MADSDDEYDHKRRDKFRGERTSDSTYRADRRDDRRGGGGGGARDDWAERNPFRGGAGGGGNRPRPEYGDYRRGGGARDRFGSPGRDLPPTKRMRPDWGDEMRGNPRFGRYPAYDPYMLQAWNDHYAQSLHNAFGGHAAIPHHREPIPPVAAVADSQTQPPMMTLKQFLETQDDNISDAEVLRKYGEYKLDFRRQQLNEFFVAHKDEEWFKSKYHPVESVKRKEEELSYRLARVEAFKEVFENGQIKNVTMDTSCSEQLLRLLDYVVIRLEGGTDYDLKALDEKPEPEQQSVFQRRIIPERKIDDKDDDVIITSVEKKVEKIEPVKIEYEAPKLVSPRPVQRQAAASDEENWDDDDDFAPAKPAAVASPVAEKEKEPPEQKKSTKRKRKNSDSSSASSSGSDSSSSSSTDWDDAEDEKVRNKYDVEEVKKEQMNAGNEVDKKAEAQDEEATNGHDELAQEKKVDEPMVDTAEKPEDISTESRASMNDGDTKSPSPPPSSPKEAEDKADNKSDIEGNKVEEKEKSVEADEKKADVAKVDGAATPKKDEVEEDKTETIDLVKAEQNAIPKPRALHRTSSIFLRNLAPSITKAEIENLCKRYDGYLRVAIADPLAERRWYRRGWVTFQRDVNIKEICWNLNNTRLRDCEMGAIVNRDLSRRVRPVSGLTAHKNIIRADIKLCAKIALNMDEKYQLWENVLAAAAAESNKNAANGNENDFGFKSKNPVLQNITDFLIEEASAEEDELLGISGDNKDGEGEVIERDPQLISVLDNIILYLRIVHSIDFYNHCEYPYEDEMPNRCGIIHARGPPPSKYTQNEIQEYIKNFESKIQTFLTKTTMIEDEELKNLGAKDAEAEVEKFIQANTQELSKDKWLCPLSGKKFKGPEFIRKHIFNKHVEKVEEVRKEVEFFNNYLRDPKRPQLPEHPGSSKRTISESSGGGGGVGYRPPIYPPAYAPPFAAYAPMMLPGRGGGGGRGGRGRNRQDFRQVIQYRDLDAPSEPIDYYH